MCHRTYNTHTCYRCAIFPDFSGIPDFHISKLSMKKNYNFNQKLGKCIKLLLFNGEDVVSALT